MLTGRLGRAAARVGEAPPARSPRASRSRRPRVEKDELLGETGGLFAETSSTLVFGAVMRTNMYVYVFSRLRARGKPAGARVTVFFYYTYAGWRSGRRICGSKYLRHGDDGILEHRQRMLDSVVRQPHAWARMLAACNTSGVHASSRILRKLPRALRSRAPISKRAACMPTGNIPRFTHQAHTYEMPVKNAFTYSLCLATLLFTAHLGAAPDRGGRRPHGGRRGQDLRGRDLRQDEQEGRGRVGGYPAGVALLAEGDHGQHGHLVQRVGNHGVVLRHMKHYRPWPIGLFDVGDRRGAIQYTHRRGTTTPCRLAGCCRMLGLLGIVAIVGTGLALRVGSMRSLLYKFSHLSGLKTEARRSR